MNARNFFLFIYLSIIVSANEALAQHGNQSSPQRASAVVVILKNIPREEVPPSPKGNWWKTPINVLTITDARVGDLKLIGHNIERSPAVAVYTRNNVPEFASNAFKAYFKQNGGITDTEAEYTLSAELVKFFVIEKNLYSGEINIGYALKNKQGLTLWSGTKIGTANVFGLSLREVNYNEAFSDALQDSFSKLLSDDGFIKAWSGKVSLKALARSMVDINSLKLELVQLTKEGFDETALLAYVKQRSISTTLLADEMIEWSNAGIPKSVITEVIKINAEK